MSGNGWWPVATADLRLDELVLRVPGLGARDAARLGELVAAKLVDRARAGVAPSSLARLQVKLDLAPGLPLETLADQIVTRIAASLGLEEG